jgi:hypothetical protein
MELNYPVLRSFLVDSVDGPHVALATTCAVLGISTHRCRIMLTQDTDWIVVLKDILALKLKYALSLQYKKYRVKIVSTESSVVSYTLCENKLVPEDFEPLKLHLAHLPEVPLCLRIRMFHGASTTCLFEFLNQYKFQCVWMTLAQVACYTPMPKWAEPQYKLGTQYLSMAVAIVLQSNRKNAVQNAFQKVVQKVVQKALINTTNSHGVFMTRFCPQTCDGRDTHPFVLRQMTQYLTSRHVCLLTRGCSLKGYRSSVWPGTCYNIYLLAFETSMPITMAVPHATWKTLADSKTRNVSTVFDSILAMYTVSH